MQQDVRKKLLSQLLTQFNQLVARPSLKAFIFAFLYVVLPRVINTVIVAVRRGQYDKIPSRFANIVRRAIHPKRFPMFAANLVAGINILEPVFYSLLKLKSKRPVYNLFVATLASSFVSSLVTFPLYQAHMANYDRFYSLDLTLLAVTRAADTTLSSLLAKVVPAAISRFGDVGLFVVSSSFIMYSWFYHPHALPPTYRKWITSAANMDNELVQILRELHNGEVQYGNQPPEKDTLKPYCERYGQNPRRGNINVHQPLECEVVHAFQTKSCEVHALWRFARGFTFAMKVYGPLNALMLLIPKNKSMRDRILKAITSSVRSSAFLGAFIGLYWYAVCLARTRLLPVLFPNVPKVQWDKTIGPLCGAIMCGFSSLVETAQRRKELALFVAPRALGTFVPQEDSKANLRIEAVAFLISMAVLVAYSKSNAASVRGIFGRGIHQVFNVNKYT